MYTQYMYVSKKHPIPVSSSFHSCYEKTSRKTNIPFHFYSVSLRAVSSVLVHLAHFSSQDLTVCEMQASLPTGPTADAFHNLPPVHVAEIDYESPVL